MIAPCYNNECGYNMRCKCVNTKDHYNTCAFKDDYDNDNESDQE